jgi:NAD(P)-dependent dehydrogenase (short-subunit alcohol dehydrogenase family)
MQLTDKIVLVTGAGQGIGRAIALACAAAGALVAVNDLNPATAADTAARLGERGLALPGDVADPATPPRLVQAAVERWGRLDGLVNNAGIVDMRPFLEITPEVWERVQRVTFFSAYYGCRAAIPQMLAQGGGRIVNISSVAGKRGGGLAGTAAYASAKAGVLGLTRALAREFGGQGIAVNAVAPGPTETAMVASLQPERRARAIANIPLGRFGEPPEIAAAVVFLLSDAASYVNGETLTVDGGLMTD